MAQPAGGLFRIEDREPWGNAALHWTSREDQAGEFAPGCHQGTSAGIAPIDLAVSDSFESLIDTLPHLCSPLIGKGNREHREGRYAIDRDGGHDAFGNARGLAGSGTSQPESVSGSMLDQGALVAIEFHVWSARCLTSRHQTVKVSQCSYHSFRRR